MFDPADWLQSGRDAIVNGVAMRPRPHPNDRAVPLATSLGQATVFYLQGERGRDWILKKFNLGRAPDAAYVGAIRGLIPHEPGFESGSGRQCLSGSMLSPNGYVSPAFAAWIEGTILMPCVRASAWGDFLSELREGRLDLDMPARISIGEDLCRKVIALEEAHLAHRDLSATNVMIDAQRSIHFIDWDSLYAPSLRMPANTPVGTPGYTAPYMRDAGDDPAASWMAGADRFALAVLVLETLAAERGSTFAGDGCLLEQDDIHARKGPTVDAAVKAARVRAGQVVALFEKALAATAPRKCPEPREWLRALHRSRTRVSSVPTAPLAGFVTLDPAWFVTLDPSRFVALRH